MPTVRFESEGAAECIAELDAMPGDKLIDLARFHEMPLHWRCGQGTCGTCKLKLILPDGQPDLAIGRLERNTLLRNGLIDSAAALQASWPADSGRWRLACHVAVGEVDMVVRLPLE